ncbi:uncharacterized protein LOC118434585 isoform X2 [Folsomia candida]|uniref:uncharacterized protein LOC118434585 isoform X2 n=1 Tax=Folsomia candida TaxID=158441 RepID=UPI0016050695|nr:uncharacterized protein LOC118434585 isoform X2 [Folsomia candida]
MKPTFWNCDLKRGKMRRTLPVVLLIIGSAECLELYRVEVPAYKRVGEAAELKCQFHLQRDRLYAVKWYKDNEEFFRYVPRFHPAIHTHPIVPGVHVDTIRSTSEVVVLKSVGVRSTGVYKCEVSAEAPSFASFMGESHMTVVYLPKEGPQITGNLRDEYEVGDILELNCTSSKSFPPAKLSWYINDMPVMGQTDPPHYDGSVELLPSSHGGSGKHLTITSHHNNNNNNNGHNLIRPTSHRLHLELTPTHFGSKGTAKIRCVARIFPLFWQDGDEKNIDHKNSTKFSKSGNKDSGHNPKNNNRININQNQHSFNEVDDGPGGFPHYHQQVHERLGSLYRGEALVQIRGGCIYPTAWKGTNVVLLILLMVLTH